ncbi:MAG: glycosyltransferase family 39 protein [Chitinophagales bacterium]
MNLNRVVLLLLFVVAIFSLITMNSFHAWGDDFAMYLMHAENIATGKPYAETGFIYNDLAPTYAPQSYPPGFPLLLAIVQPFFGLNFLAYKIYILLFFLIFLWLVYVWLKDKVDGRYVVGIIIALGFNPFIWQFRDNILSDIPCAAAIFAALILHEKAENTGLKMDWVILGFVVFIAFAIRSTAIVLLLAIIIYHIKNIRKNGIYLIIILSEFILLNVICGILFNYDSNYLSMIAATYGEHSNKEIFEIIKYYTGQYYAEFKDLFIYKYHNLFTNDILVLLGQILFLFGFVISLIQKRFLIALFFTGYIILILLWPGFQGLRYFLPIIPLYFFFTIIGISKIKIKSIRIGLEAILGLSILVTYISYYSNVNYKQDNYSLNGIQSRELIQFITDEIPANSNVMAAKPRALCLFADINGMVFPDPENKDSIFTCLQINKIQYLVVNAYSSYPSYATKLIAQSPAMFTQLFLNKEWAVYKIN